MIGYSLAFSPSLGGFIGSLAYVALNGVGLERNTDYAGTIPHQAFMICQMMFAVVTPALWEGYISAAQEVLPDATKVIKRRCYGLTNLSRFFQRITLDLMGEHWFSPWRQPAHKISPPSR